MLGGEALPSLLRLGIVNLINTMLASIILCCLRNQQLFNEGEVKVTGDREMGFSVENRRRSMTISYGRLSIATRRPTSQRRKRKLEIYRVNDDGMTANVEKRRRFTKVIVRSFRIPTMDDFDLEEKEELVFKQTEMVAKDRMAIGNTSLPI
ncbi:unnamed protein product [Linum trigynum]|uniref:Uncharacterized protein n=1 Tax=Linum trigynum TaxID=586398 RepID=A0AAV2F6V4_9ROSI